MSMQMKAGTGQNQERTVQSHIQCSGSTLLHQCKCEWVFGFIHVPAVFQHIPSACFSPIDYLYSIWSETHVI